MKPIGNGLEWTPTVNSWPVIAISLSWAVLRTIWEKEDCNWLKEGPIGKQLTCQIQHIIFSTIFWTDRWRTVGLWLAGRWTNRKQLTCHIQLFIFSSLLHCSEASSTETAEAHETGGSNSTMKKPETIRKFWRYGKHVKAKPNRLCCGPGSGVP